MKKWGIIAASLPAFAVSIAISLYILSTYIIEPYYIFSRQGFQNAIPTILVVLICWGTSIWVLRANGVGWAVLRMFVSVVASVASFLIFIVFVVRMFYLGL